MMIYARGGGSPVLATLNDIAPITGCVRWQDTHERTNYEELARFLSHEGANDLVSGMDSHLAVDEAMHGPHSPIYPNMQDISDVLGELDRLPRTSNLGIQPGNEGHARLAELVVETSLDGVVAESEPSLLDLIEFSRRQLDVDRIALLFARFFGRDGKSFRRCFDLLHSHSAYAASSIDGLAQSFLDLYEETSTNLARLLPPEPSARFYPYMKEWFTDPARMAILRQLEKRARPRLAEAYEGLKVLDFPAIRPIT